MIKKYLLISFLVIISTIFNKMCGQENCSKFWIYSEKAYLISDTTKNHDTIACLRWLDSICYFSYQNEWPSWKLFASDYWMPISYQNKKGWIKTSDFSSDRSIIKGDKYSAFFQETIFGQTLRTYINCVILDKNNKVKRNFIKLPFTIGERNYIKENGYYFSFTDAKWINLNNFLFNCNGLLFLYTAKTDSVIRLDSSVQYIYNQTLNRLICLSYRSNYVDYVYQKEITLKSMTLNGYRKEYLMKLHDNSIELGFEEAERIYYDFKIDKFNGRSCYSFRVTNRDESPARIFVDLKGQYLAKVNDKF
jgi:hypothetical protein